MSDTVVDDASKALWGVCKRCGHNWAAAYYPISMKTLAKIIKRHSRCPKCDGVGLVAKQDNGVLKESSPNRETETGK